ncbi:MAG: amidohydrolase [Clostridiales bacterium]|nr:amidohydrolase [Clostridiales bacterium]
MDLNKVRQAVEEVFDEIVAIRRDIHMHPELSEHEERTMHVISDYLTKLGIPHETNVSGYGVVGIVGDPNADFAVGIRADIDALPIQEENDVPYASKNPGVMHACGHDIHTACLLGVARILKGMESELKGAVKLFFQPAEETIGGAEGMIKWGCMENPPVKHVFSLHADPTYPVGKVLVSTGRMNASTTDLHIRVNGISCHGAHPDNGIDSIVVASHVVLALQTISSRFASPTTPVIVTVGSIHGGTKSNIIAGSVDLVGTIRALDFKTRDFVKAHVEEIAKNTAAAFGATAEVELEDGYPPLVNDRAVSMRVAEICREALGNDSVVFMEEPSLGADDFAYFSAAVPSSYFNIGTMSDKCTTPQMLHSEVFCPDEECLKVGMVMEAACAIAFLEEQK